MFVFWMVAILYSPPPAAAPASPSPSIDVQLEAARARRQAGDLAEARRQVEAVLATLDAVASKHFGWYGAQGEALGLLADVAWEQGDRAAARRALEASRSLRPALERQAPPGFSFLASFALDEQKLGWLAWLEGDGAAARRHFEAAVALHDQALGSTDGGNPGWQRAWALKIAGDGAWVLGDLGAARTHYRAALALLGGPTEPDEEQLKRGRVVVHLALGDLALASDDSGGVDSAAEHYQAARTLDDQLSAQARFAWRMARLEARKGQLEAARRHLQVALAEVLSSVKADPSTVDDLLAAEVYLAAAEVEAAQVEVARGYREAAREHLARLGDRVNVLQMGARERTRQALKRPL
jgi:tetratricopeptide (TPR) repeat protein